MKVHPVLVFRFAITPSVLTQIYFSSFQFAVFRLPICSSSASLIPFVVLVFFPGFSQWLQHCCSPGISFS